MCVCVSQAYRAAVQKSLPPGFAGLQRFTKRQDPNPGCHEIRTPKVPPKTATALSLRALRLFRSRPGSLSLSRQIEGTRRLRGTLSLKVMKMAWRCTEPQDSGGLPFGLRTSCSSSRNTMRQGDLEQSCPLPPSCKVKGSIQTSYRERHAESA